jgi:hypothetical protein
MRTHKAFPLLLAASLALSRGAWAQTPQDRATARMLAQDADKKLSAKQYSEALALFIKADALVPAPTLKVAIANTRVLLGQLVEAQQLLLDVARSQPLPGEPAPWAQARGEAKATANQLTPRLAALELTVEGPSADRLPTVVIDGETINANALGVPRVMNPGHHAIKIEAQGFLASSREVDLAEGQRVKMSIALERDASAPLVPPPAGSTASPAASGTAPAAPGKPGEAAHPDAAPGSYRTAIFGFVMAGVFGGVGAATGLISMGRVDDLKAKCPDNRCDPSLKDDADGARRLGTISNVTFGLASVGLVIGVIGLVTGGAPQAAASGARGGSVRLGVGPGSVSLAGSF